MLTEAKSEIKSVEISKSVDQIKHNSNVGIDYEERIKVLVNKRED